MRFTSYPDFIKIFYHRAIKSFPGRTGELFFTFDDGPHPGVTPYILDILKEHNAKATFFCLGENVVLYPQLFKRIKDEGHSVGNHGYHHIHGFKLSAKKFRENFWKADSVIKSTLFRPPYGYLSPLQYMRTNKNYKIIFWDVIAYDFDKKTTADRMKEIILTKAKSGSIVLLHDNIKSKEKILKVLPEMLEILANKGFCFKSIL